MTAESMRDLLRGVAIAALAGAVMALSGAFTGPGLPLVSRLAYWVPVMVMGGLWGHVCTLIVERFIDLDDRPWLQVAMITAVMYGPLVLMVWAATGVFFAGELYPLSALGQIALPVLVVTATMSAINVFVTKARTVQTHEALPGQAPARFLDRLPQKLKGAQLIAVQSEDHYLRLHTDRGSDLILMRLADALAELEGLEGAQTHRSWWVARDAVRDVARGDGRATLTLDGGLSVPVSRRHSRALRAAGWY